ncbi:MAG: tryptophan synthase subunit alpha [Pseudomonadota bacterium]|nr:tryptophan synthase subunit alpha [Pseudomonadota bacterium]
MSRLDHRLTQVRAAGRKSLVPYVAAGDPAGEDTVALLHALAAAGADVIELGVPFSDPMADGPTVALACERALAKGTRLVDVLDMVRRFRRDDVHTPIVLMGYLNPIESMGYQRFSEAASEAGVDGVLIVDLTPEEAPDVTPALREAGLDPIFLAAPNTSLERLAAIGREAAGYLYYVSLKGVTGSSQLNTDEVAARVDLLKAHTGIPVLVGFGIRDADTAATIASTADGVVIGSALIQALVDRGGQSAVDAATAFLAPIRAAMDAGATPSGNAA